MTTAMITGACGFCAVHLAKKLASQGGIRTIGIDIRERPPTGLPLDDYISVDIGDRAQVSDAVARVKPDLVFHLAGLVRGDAAELFRVNLLGGIHLMEAILESAPDARTLVVGSAAEYGHVPESEMPITEEHPCNPIGPYGLSKYSLTLAALDYARNRGLKVSVARPFNIVGAGVPRSLVVGAILHRATLALAESDQPCVTVGNLDTERDFVAVDDVVDGYLQMVQSDHWGEVFNICSGTACSIRSVIERLLAHSPKPIELKVDPALVRPADVKSVYGDCGKANRLLGFVPGTSLDSALLCAWDHSMEGVGS